MAMMKLIVPAFLCVVAFTNNVTAQCGGCYTKHPQQIYCDSDFVFRITVISVTKSVRAPGGSRQDHKLVEGMMIDNLKSTTPGRGDTVYIYSPSSFCGTSVTTGTDYLVVGSFAESDDGEMYLEQGSCDRAEIWDELSERQQKGFEMKYKRLCDCTITPVRSASNQRVVDFSDGSGYEGANSYWTPVDCYYNPFKTKEYKMDDCEEEYGFCKSSKGGSCSWQTTTDYVNCFKGREERVELDESLPAITNIEQCKLLPRRRRKACRKQVKENLLELELEVMYYEET